MVAIPTPFRDDLSVDFDRLQEHVRWLADSGCHAVAPAGALGEYQALSESERAEVVRATVQAAPAGCAVVAGVGGYGSRQSRRWAEQAAEAGAAAVLAPPPDGYPARDAEVVAHYREVAAVGLPVVAVNNPAETRVDLTPELLATVAETDGVVAVTDFSGDPRRLRRIVDLCPHLDTLAGADDVSLELLICGARGWLTGSANALPALCRRLHDHCAARDLERAMRLYAELHPVLGWGARTESAQAVKLVMSYVGRYGGPCRPPRGPLPVALADRIRRDLRRALAVPTPG